MSNLNNCILAFFANFVGSKFGLSGNTVWTIALVFQKLSELNLKRNGNVEKMRHFW